MPMKIQWVSVSLRSARHMRVASAPHELARLGLDAGQQRAVRGGELRHAVLLQLPGDRGEIDARLGQRLQLGPVDAAMPSRIRTAGRPWSR